MGDDSSATIDSPSPTALRRRLASSASVIWFSLLSAFAWFRHDKVFVEPAHLFGTTLWPGHPELAVGATWLVAGLAGAWLWTRRPLRPGTATPLAYVSIALLFTFAAWLGQVLVIDCIDGAIALERRSRIVLPLELGTPARAAIAAMFAAAVAAAGWLSVSPKPGASGKRGRGNAALIAAGSVAFAAIVANWLLGFFESLAACSFPTKAALVTPSALALLACISLLATWVRRRPLRVFISFQHGVEPAAVELEEALTRDGAEPRRIPFRPGAAHDDLLERIQDELRRCDLFACIPGPHASFVEHEVFASSSSRTPMVFILPESNARLPDTAFRGYPAFRREAVASLRYAPVVFLVQLIGGEWSATWRHLTSGFRKRIAGLTAPLVAASAICAYLGGSCVAFAQEGLGGVGKFLLEFHSETWHVVVRATVAMLRPFVGLHLFLVGSALLLASLRRARSILRQTIRTGTLTRPLLAHHLGAGPHTQSLLDCLFESQPLPRHEAPSHGLTPGE